MKVIKDQVATLKKGRTVTIELEDGEELIAVRNDRHYRLGYPVSDVVIGQVLVDIEEVTWCSVGQEWVS